LEQECLPAVDSATFDAAIGEPFRFRNRKVARAAGRSTNHSHEEQRVQYEEADFPFAVMKQHHGKKNKTGAPKAISILITPV
jgi:hypothetical protein